MKRFKLIPAVYIVLRNDTSILMLQRKNTGYHDGDFSLPAGHVDGGESLMHAAVREAKEELGIAIEYRHMQLVHVQHRSSELSPEGEERIDFYFQAKKWAGEIKNMEPERCQRIKWIDTASLPRNIVPSVKFVIGCLAAGRIYSGLNWLNNKE